MEGQELRKIHKKSIHLNLRNVENSLWKKQNNFVQLFVEFCRFVCLKLLMQNCFPRTMFAKQHVQNYFAKLPEGECWRVGLLVGKAPQKEVSRKRLTADALEGSIQNWQHQKKYSKRLEIQIHPLDRIILKLCKPVLLWVSWPMPSVLVLQTELGSWSLPVWISLNIKYFFFLRFAPFWIFHECLQFCMLVWNISQWSALCKIFHNIPHVCVSSWFVCLLLK